MQRYIFILYSELQWYTRVEYALLWSALVLTLKVPNGIRYLYFCFGDSGDLFVHAGRQNIFM